jgi:formate hydrogenlyase subunit 6/NADH:ubiquinone oxidoreductase subunit I
VETVFISKLKPLLDAVAQKMTLFVPRKNDEHYDFVKYDTTLSEQHLFNNIRACTPTKEFLFPMRELAAVFPQPQEAPKVESFAVFGLKDCDLKAIKILDCVFDEGDFKDPSYIERRNNMFIITSDCSEPAESCCCTLFDGQPFPDSGFDLNISKIKDGFIIQSGSEKGAQFIAEHKNLFADVPSAATTERDQNRTKTRELLDQNNADYQLDTPVRDIVENSRESDLFDNEANSCVECQACTRVCPTCHCFFLFDSASSNSYAKTKMWDSCVRRDFAAVAGDENPRKILGDRTRHRLLHKFVYFLDRYGIKMCTGCGRCIDACAGEMELRDVLKKLNEELKSKK